jgi:outer membrane protein assembly factor BamB
MSIIGEGSWRYDFQRDWAKLPRWWNLGETGHAGPPRTSVQGAVAANGDVYVLCRAAHPVLIFDASGAFVSSWGEGKFSTFVHGLSIDRDGKIWIADSGLHTVTQHEPDGTLLRTLGTPNAAAPTFYGQPFNMPTGTAFTSDGDVFVSDGYGNRRVHRFSPDGTLKYMGRTRHRSRTIRAGALRRYRPGGPDLRVRPGQSPHPDLLSDRCVPGGMERI